MAHPLVSIDVADPEALVGPLSEAMIGTGPAVFPITGMAPDSVPVEVPDEVVIVVETSGSTARPKRVWHTADSLRVAAQQSNRALQQGRPGSHRPAVWWLALPAHYIAGVMVFARAIDSGGTVVAKQDNEGLVEGLLRFHRDATAEDSPGGSRPRFTSLVPKQLTDMVAAAQSDPLVLEALCAFDRVLVGGQRVPDTLLDDANRLGVTVTKTYGSAETAGGCVWEGVPLSDTEVAVIDQRIAISGPMLAGGYLNDSERTNQSFIERDDKRWFVTDDIGDISRGVLTVTGRADRVIIAGGVKVNLDEAEVSLQSMFPDVPLVTAAVEDPSWGEAIVVLAEHRLDPATVQGHLRAVFGAAAQVSRVQQVHSLPRLSSGKLDRQAISVLVGRSQD